MNYLERNPFFDIQMTLGDLCNVLQLIGYVNPLCTIYGELEVLLYSRDKLKVRIICRVHLRDFL